MRGCFCPGTKLGETLRQTIITDRGDVQPLCEEISLFQQVQFASPCTGAQGARAGDAVLSPGHAARHCGADDRAAGHYAHWCILLVHRRFLWDIVQCQSQERLVLTGGIAAEAGSTGDSGPPGAHALAL